MVRVVEHALEHDVHAPGTWPGTIFRRGALQRQCPRAPESGRRRTSCCARRRSCSPACRMCAFTKSASTTSGTVGRAVSLPGFGAAGHVGRDRPISFLPLGHAAVENRRSRAEPRVLQREQRSSRGGHPIVAVVDRRCASRREMPSCSRRCRSWSGGSISSASFVVSIVIGDETSWSSRNRAPGMWPASYSGFSPTWSSTSFGFLSCVASQSLVTSRSLRVSLPVGVVFCAAAARDGCREQRDRHGRTSRERAESVQHVGCPRGWSFGGRRPIADRTWRGRYARASRWRRWNCPSLVADACEGCARSVMATLARASWAA